MKRDGWIDALIVLAIIALVFIGLWWTA